MNLKQNGIDIKQASDKDKQFKQWTLPLGVYAPGLQVLTYRHQVSPGVRIDENTGNTKCDMRYNDLGGAHEWRTEQASAVPLAGGDANFYMKRKRGRR